jgi:hypothetical protein
MIRVFQYDAKTHRNFKRGEKIQNQKGEEAGLKCETPDDTDIYIKDLPFTEWGLRIYVTLYL